jgi:PAS domain S-box-containing protein
LKDSTKISDFNFALQMLDFIDFEGASDHLISVLENFPIPIWAYNNRGIFVFWNKEAEKLFGYSSIKILGSSDNISVYKNIPANKAETLQKQFTSQNGKIFILQLNFLQKPADAGNIHTWVCGYNITRFMDTDKKTTDKINHLKNLEKILIRSDSFIYIRENDLDWQLSYISPNFYNFFGPIENYSGHNPICLAKYIHPDDIIRIKAEILIAEHERRDQMHLEYRITNNSDKTIWVSDAMEMIRNSNGSIIKIQGVITDITYQKEAEVKIKEQHKIIRKRNTELTLAHEKLKKSYTDITLAHEKLTENEIALRESEERYRQLVQTSPDVIALSDLQGALIYASPRCRKFFGYPEDEPIEGKNISQFIDPNDLNQARNEVANVKSAEKLFAGTYTMIKKDQSRFFVEVNSNLINDYQGNAKAMISILRDVTERKLVEEELIKAKNKAEESDSLKSAFLANMSHEIRTPMNGILGFAQLLNDENISEQDRDEYINIINQNGAILLKLIDDILDIAKMEAGQLKIFEKPCYINQLLYDEYLLFEKLIENQSTKKLKLILNLPPFNLDHEVLLDPSRFNQIITNLLGNALKFTKNGFIEFGYTLESPSWLKFYVRDTGIGMPPEKHKIIFDRFRQADETNARNYGGTGLGLTISSNLVKLMGGKMWVDSEVNMGTTFYFYIPYKPINNSDSIKEIATTKDKPKNYIWKNIKILIAEDEDVNFLYLEKLLKHTDAEIIRAKNGKEALEYCKSDPKIDLVIMDIKMPHMNGYTATREIKKIRNNVPIIAHTAYAMEEEKNECFNSGCNAYLTKPTDRLQLLRTLDHFITTKNNK